MFADLPLKCQALRKSFKTSDKAGARKLSDDTICHEHPPGVQDIIAEQDGVLYQPDIRRDESVIQA